MKTQGMKKLSILMIAFLMIAGSSAFGQRGKGYRNYPDRAGRQDIVCQRIPDLTEDQENKIEALRVTHWKEMNSFRNQMNELRARKQTLNTSDKANLDEINAVIDQMTGVHNKMMKAGAKHRQDVRNLLTDDQKVYFDSMPARGRGYGRGAGRAGDGYGNYRGMRQGYGAGYGYRNDNFQSDDD